MEKELLIKNLKSISSSYDEILERIEGVDLDIFRELIQVSKNIYRLTKEVENNEY